MSPARVVVRSQGPKGDPGIITLRNRGTWQPNTAYALGDIVQNEGSSWYVTTPYTSTSFFSVANLIPLGAPKLFINAYDYGVRGDGSQSSASANTTGLLSAIDYAYARGGGIVWVPFGLVFVNQTIEVDQYVGLWGSGIGATLLALADNANCHVVKNFVSTGAGVANASRLNLMHLTIDGRKAAQSGSGPYYGISFNTNPATTAQSGTALEAFDMIHHVDHVRVRHTKGDGIHLAGRSGIQIANTLVENAAGYGVYSTFDLNLINVDCASSDLSGFYLNNGSIRGSNLKAYTNGQSHTDDGDGIRLGPNANGVALAAVEAQNNWARGVYLNGANRCNIEGVVDSNNMAAADYVGVELNAASYNLVGVVSWQGSQSGIKVGNQDVALKVAGGSNYNDIRMSHSAAPGTSITGPAIHTDSVYLTNTIVMNGVSVNAPAPPAITIIDEQVYENPNGPGGAAAAYSWNKPGNAAYIDVIIVGAGGGGASGRRGAAASTRTGGGGGSGGGVVRARIEASDLGATVSVSVGSGGAGGAAQTVDSTNGAAGGAGLLSSFGTSFLRANGGFGGAGGSTSAVNGGSAQQTSAAGGQGTSTTTPGAGGNANEVDGTAGGGGGGCLTSADATSNGGAGGQVAASYDSTSAGGTAPGGAGNAGSAKTAADGTERTWTTIPGRGAAGGASGDAVTAGGAGASATGFGHGGGGGGGSLNGLASGAGGAGAPGVVIVRTWGTP